MQARVTTLSTTVSGPPIGSGNLRPHAETGGQAAHAHVVAVLAEPGAPSVELAVPNAVFGMPHTKLMRILGSVPHWYEVRSSTAGFEDTGVGIDQLANAGTIIVAGDPGIPPGPPTSALQHSLRSAHARRSRIVAVGSGAFVLAASGVLAGRRATAHWSVVDELRRRHPDVLVEDRPLYTEDHGIYTSAGAASTLDLCLELVRRDHGATVANAVSRWMVAPPHRAGEQQQRVATPLAEHGGLAHVLDWASARLDQPLALADLARAAGVSPRTLARRFHAALGTTPLQWLLVQRIRLAQELLESTENPVEQVAELSGLGSPGNLRLQFTRAFGISPHRYRQRFRAARVTRSA